MTKTMSSHAAAAKAIRQELKEAFPETTFSVRSKSYSGGSSVYADWTDGPRSEDVHKIIDKYQYGHFDGMIDLYEYSNTRDDIPQVMFVLPQRSMSDELGARIKKDIGKRFGVDMDNEKAVLETFHDWPDSVIYREFRSGFYTRD